MQNKKLFNKLSVTFGFNSKSVRKKDVVEKNITINPPSYKNSQDKIFDSFSGFIIENPINSRVFIHFTRDKSIADSILENGFKFADCFYKTTQEVTLNKVDLNYKLQLYNIYGNYLIVLGIPLELLDNSPLDEKMDNEFSLIENGLCNELEDDYFNFLLPPVFINGYFDLHNNIIIRNEKFLKDFDLAFYKTRIKEEFIKKGNFPRECN